MIIKFLKENPSIFLPLIVIMGIFYVVGGFDLGALFFGFIIGLIISGVFAILVLIDSQNTSKEELK